jgi:hypothetical protein
MPVASRSWLHNGRFTSGSRAVAAWRDYTGGVEIIVVVLFLVVVPILLLFVGGIALIRSGLRKPPLDENPDTLPAAQVVSGGTSPLREGGQSNGRVVVNALKIGIGTVLIGGGIAVIAGIYSFFTTPLLGESSSKGRLLRLRGKARLPGVAKGRGWADDASPRVAHLTAAERRTLADAWLLSARMEHASIPAFAQLSLHLAALGAPSELVERTHTAALDELRHTRRCFAMANAYAGESWTAGPIAELATGGRGAAVDHVRLAVGSLVDGCLAEGIASDVAALGAGRAEDPVVRDALAMIASDEEQHAELAWSVLAWCLTTGGDDVHAAVAARTSRLSDELAPRAPDFAGVDRDRLAAHGLFDQETLGAVATARVAQVAARATELLATHAPARLAA